MNKTNNRSLQYGLIGLASLLVSSLGYLYGHKLLEAAPLAGVLTALWQVVAAFALLCVAGGLGERLLKFTGMTGPVRFALDVAVGLAPLSVAVLVLGSVVGTSAAVLIIPLAAALTLLARDGIAWLRNLGELRALAAGGYERFLAAGTLFILLTALLYALAPPLEFDALTYHLALPQAYLQQGRIAYQADSMFWGMPQLVETLYVPLMRVAGAQAAAVFAWMIGATALIGLFGTVRGTFGQAAAWTAVAALVIGENLAHSLSTAYVDWTCILLGWAALAALCAWMEQHDRRWLLLAGGLCGAALGSKYTAGVLLIGVALAILLLDRERSFWQRVASVAMVGAAAAVVSSPWWIRNALATGNPFYPFLFPAGAMDQSRLDFYQKVPVWRDWRAVILLPWQATFFGIDGKEGYAASIGPLLVGLSPLAWVGWRERDEAQKRLIRVAAVLILTGLIIWAIGSRVSGLLIQGRLYVAVFPAWALLAGAGLDGIANLKAAGIRFDRLMRVLVCLMFGLSLFAALTSFIERNPALDIVRGEAETAYLGRALPSYAAAMEAIEGLPTGSRVLMLWEARGYYCQPRCDADEVIDRWFDEARLHGSSAELLRAWREAGYTDLLIFNLGREFVQEFDYPEDGFMHWTLLDATLGAMPVEKQIAGGAYTLYKIP